MKHSIITISAVSIILFGWLILFSPGQSIAGPFVFQADEPSEIIVDEDEIEVEAEAQEDQPEMTETEAPPPPPAPAPAKPDIQRDSELKPLSDLPKPEKEEPGPGQREEKKLTPEEIKEQKLEDFYSEGEIDSDSREIYEEIDPVLQDLMIRE